MHISSKSLLTACVLLASLTATQASQAAGDLFSRVNILANANGGVHGGGVHGIFEKPEARTGQTVIATTPSRGGPVVPPHGGINPIGDVSCTQGQQILAADGFEVYFSDCNWYIYKFRATQGVTISEISMSSFTGEYTSQIIGIARK